MTIKNQKIQLEPRTFSYHGRAARIRATVRHDDSCGNGHNSFAITGDIYTGGRWEAGGCIHDEIREAYPEIAHLIKWHLCSTDEPMHYIANTTYHARDCSHDGKKPGDPVAWETRLQFQGTPFTFSEPKKGFFDYIDEVGDWNNIEVEPVPYDGTDSYDFKPHYTLTGFIKENETRKWYKAPFGSEREALEFLDALRTRQIRFVKHATAWAEAVTPNLEAARSCAIWPEATLEQLRDKEALAARLPELMAEFKRDVEALGLIWDTPECSD